MDPVRDRTHHMIVLFCWLCRQLLQSSWYELNSSKVFLQESKTKWLAGRV
jgi:hypothetical protein